MTCNRSTMSSCHLNHWTNWSREHYALALYISRFQIRRRTQAHPETNTNVANKLCAWAEVCYCEYRHCSNSIVAAIHSEMIWAKMEKYTLISYVWNVFTDTRSHSSARFFLSPVLFTSFHWISLGGSTNLVDEKAFSFEAVERI